MLEVCLFCCSCIVCALLLVCAGLETLHLIKHIINEEECRSVGKAGDWWDDELAMTIAVKAPSVVQETLDVLKGDLAAKGDTSYGYIAKQIKSKLCST